MILSKEVEVKISTSNVEHYKSLGYEIPMRKATELSKKVMKKDYVYDIGSTITVKVKDLTKGANAILELLCDYCKETVFTQTYLTYQRTIKDIPKCACVKCRHLKVKELNQIKYGYDWAAQTEEFQERRKNTVMEKYGTLNFWEIPEFREKYEATCTDRYGKPYYSQTEEFSQKFIETCRKNRGTDYPTQSPEVREKIRSVVNEKYGVNNVFASDEIIKKIHATLFENGTAPISKQQRFLFNLYKNDNKVELNYPLGHYSIDVFFLEDKICLEYSGGGHWLSCEIGRITKEEFNKKEIIRNSYIKNEGYKKIEVVSSTDKLPSDQVLLQMLSESRQYFSTTSHTWQTYDIDQSLLFNAEHPQGVPYSFGELRTIKDTKVSFATDVNTSAIKDTDVSNSIT